MKSIVTAIAFISALSANAGPAHHETNDIAKIWCGYRKIDITDVPIAILKQISDKYYGYSVSGAYTSEEGENEYKLVLVNKGRIVIAYYKHTGDFIKDEMK
ncbi:hypothetical protein HYN59_17605 [Flavobacterium album]|uniref:Beta-lactamase-inhibitor-like PepSY-like domain-containing protein n=1 Tax=Flavobacterium album TaxID=2175091 RepID=A0A2S1R266_9FLAO|nr:hypothetical protein [Flavobacterium album]AWH86813.1 hypothetical protein HYN59_17605 [Flavobacterium album]